MKRNLLNIRVTEGRKRGLKTESSRRRKAAAFCFSVLLAIGVVFSGFAACGFGSPFVNTAYAASYDAEDVQVSQDGVTFTCDFLDDGTAVVTKIVADDGVTTVSVPPSLANNGKSLPSLVPLQTSAAPCRIAIVLKSSLSAKVLKSLVQT